jgi:hypothetical protein
MPTAASLTVGYCLRPKYIGFRNAGIPNIPKLFSIVRVAYGI